MKREKRILMRNIAEGDRIYSEMKKSMLSVQPTVGSLVSMNYALSKLMANYKLAMQKIDIDVDCYFKDMANWWEMKLKAEESDDQLDFDAFALTVERLSEA